MSKVQKLIDSALCESDMAPSLKEFFLSRRPAIIYGAGNQGKIVREYCKVFRKKVLGFLVSPGGEVRLSAGLSDACHRLDEMPPDWCDADADCIIALGERHREEVAAALRGAAMPHITEVLDWGKANEQMFMARSAFFAKAEALSLSLASRLQGQEEAKAGRKRLFLHMGMPKCGSTTLQSFLSKNREILRQHGAYYPQTVNGLDNHLQLLQDVCDVFPHPCTSTQELYIDDAISSDCDCILLSNELFCYFFNSLPNFQKLFTCSYIYYLEDVRHVF